MYTEKRLNERIAKWHKRAEEDKTPLHEYLGWTWEEYKQWIDTGRQPSK